MDRALALGHLRGKPAGHPLMQARGPSPAWTSGMRPTLIKQPDAAVTTARFATRDVMTVSIAPGREQRPVGLASMSRLGVPCGGLPHEQRPWPRGATTLGAAGPGRYACRGPSDAMMPVCAPSRVVVLPRSARPCGATRALRRSLRARQLPAPIRASVRQLSRDARRASWHPRRIERPPGGCAMADWEIPLGDSSGVEGDRGPRARGTPRSAPGMTRA